MKHVKNISLADEIVVRQIAGEKAVIDCNRLGDCEQLAELGFANESGVMVRSITSSSERETLVRKLIKMKALFPVGPGWSPAELVDYYRETGLIAGAYRAIRWKGPGDFYIEERHVE